MDVTFWDEKKAVLALDTGLSGCVVGVYTPATDAFFETVLLTGRDQAARLVPMIDACLAKAQLGYADLGLVVCAVGPGSFTGLRIGMTTASMIALARDIPTQPVGTMDAMIATAKEAADIGDRMACVLETKRSDYYFGLQDAQTGQWLVPPCSASSADIQGLCAHHKPDGFCGDATDRLASDCPDIFVTARIYAHSLLSAKALCRIGYNGFCLNNGVSKPLEPLYLRGADVSKSNKVQRVIGDYS